MARVVLGIFLLYLRSTFEELVVFLPCATLAQRSSLLPLHIGLQSLLVLA